MKKILTMGFLGLFTLSVLLPLLWVLSSSFKAGYDILGSPWSLPIHPQFVNYKNAWNEAGIGQAFFTSLLVTVSTLAILLPISAMAAYVLAKYVFPGSKIILTTFLGGMMFPHFLVIVPVYLLLKQMHLLDTLQGLVLVYVAYSLSFTVFVLHGFFEVLPNELAEAAMLDGCGHSRTFWQVMLPLAKPGLVVVGIFDAIGLWNEYVLALVLLTDPKHQTLPLGIANLTMTEQYKSDWGALFAGLVIVMVPVLIVYSIYKDRIHEAMLAGAIK